MTRGLRQALVMLVFAIVTSAAVAAVWSTLGDAGFRRSFATAVLVIAGLLAVSGGTVLSRAATSDARAFLGMGPDREEPDSGEGLTAFGVFLLVALPLFVAGALLFGPG